MHPKGSRKCRHCGEFFVADVRNLRRQWYCAKSPCRKARKAETQRHWLSRPENADYFRGPENVARVRAWRAANPTRRTRLTKKLVLQDLMCAEPSDNQRRASQDDGRVLQDTFASKDPALVGLIAHLAGSSLQDTIGELVRRLECRGRLLIDAKAHRSTEQNSAASLHSSHTSRSNR